MEYDQYKHPFLFSFSLLLFTSSSLLLLAVDYIDRQQCFTRYGMSQQSHYNLSFDGLVRVLAVDQFSTARPGVMAYGWIITCNNQLFARGYGTYADTWQAASNRAEYLALIEGLEALSDLNSWDESVLISGDAKCVLDQVSGMKPVKSVATLPLYLRAIHLIRRFRCIDFNWIPRKNNREADRLTRYALRQLQQDEITFQGTLRAIGRKDQLSSTTKLFPVLDIRVYQRHANSSGIFVST